MYKIITEFFLYILTSLPVTMVILLILFFSIPKPDLADYQVRLPSKYGIHILDMSQGFTKVTLQPDGKIRVLDKVYCSTHEELESFVRPVGFWTMGTSTTVAPGDGPDDGPDEVLEWKYES